METKVVSHKTPSTPSKLAQTKTKFLRLGLSAFAFERKPGGSCGDVQTDTSRTSGSF